MKFYSILFFLIIGILACSQEQNTKNQANLIGDWRGIHWEVNGVKSEKTARTLIFRFSDDGQFVSDLGADPLRGMYQLDGEKLHLTQKDKTKVTGIIKNINPDTLVLGFTHRGNPEQMTFVRRY